MSRKSKLGRNRPGRPNRRRRGVIRTPPMREDPPRRPETRPPDGRDGPARSVQSSSDMQAPLVLVSTDDQTLFAAVLEQARAAGLRVTHAPAPLLFEAARMRRPAAIVLDMQQRTDGCLLLSVLRRDARTSSVPVFPVTSVVDEHLRRFCIAHRVRHLETKPISAELLRRVRECAGLAPPTRAPATAG